MELYLYLLAGGSLLLLVFCSMLAVRLKRLTQRYQEFMSGTDSVSLEGMLVNLHADLRSVAAEIKENRQQMSLLQHNFVSTVRGIGVVRFNAFQNTGGDLSFAVALLNGKQDGVIFSSIYGREESRFYAKPVTAAQSTYKLSAEEQEAVRQATAMLVTQAEKL
ncbi:MAG TPA: DUF4446 family protein [Oscillospiraceae bacterium]|nr:DUF4446 family protein [Oscillospiraceae bacterium]